MTQRHVMAQLLRPNLCRMQPGIRRVSVRRQPIVDKRFQLSRCVCIRQILTLDRQAQ
jgi:hypothetical protein